MNELDYANMTEIEFWSIYYQNEQINAHSENVLHMANLVGNAHQIDLAKVILHKHNRTGYLTYELNIERMELRKELSRQLLPYIFKK
jgi:hypothetical protein